MIHLILFLMDNGFVSSRFIQIYIYIQVFRWKKSHYHLEYMFLKMDTCICIQKFRSTQGRSQRWWCYHCISFCYVQYDNRCKLMERHRRVILAPKQGHHQMMIGQCQFSTRMLNRVLWRWKSCKLNFRHRIYCKNDYLILMQMMEFDNELLWKLGQGS